MDILEWLVKALGVTLMFTINTVAAIVTWRRRHHWVRPRLGPFLGTGLAFYFGVFVLPYYAVRYGLLGKH